MEAFDMKIVAVENVSLDGVMQAPGRPDEDLRGGFEHGGWAVPYPDPVTGQAMGQGMANTGAMLFGRRTFIDFFNVWPKRTNNPYTEVLNNGQKSVAPTPLSNPLPWQNSTLITGDVPAAVARLKAEGGKALVVLGSGELLRSLMLHRLVDEYVLLIHPLVLGSGRRLFPDAGAFEKLELVRAIPTTTGVVIGTYRAVQDAFTAALARWPASGIPPSPAGWIVTTARNQLIDRLRREASREDRHAQASVLYSVSSHPIPRSPRGGAAG